MAKNHLIEGAQQKLHSSRQIYIDGLSAYQMDENTWVVQLEASAKWAEDGMCVVYGKANNHMPSVLTPDGWVKIKDVKEGMLVLNQFKKWTPVLKIHDNDLFDYCIEFIDEEETQKRFGNVKNKKYDHYRGTGKRSKKNNIVVRCANCHNTRETSRFSFTDGANARHCGNCLKLKKLIRFKVIKQGFEAGLVLTEDHPVMTERGWILAKDLLPNDKVGMPAWGSCKQCSKKVLFGGDFCNSGCFQSHYQKHLLDIGKHPSQDPDWKAKWFRQSGANKSSGIEGVVARLLEKAGETVKIFGEECLEADWIRQYPVPSSIDKLGRQKYYYIDFFNPKLGLALEIDGFFHFTTEGIRRGNIRDQVLIDQKIQTVRIPAKDIKSGHFEKQSLPAILANHYGDIDIIFSKLTQLKKITPSKYTAFSRRWDITVAEGESFVCQGALIHNSPHNMLEDLLASPKAKTNAKGGKYLSVPFKHGQPPTSSTPAQRNLDQTINKTMKSFGISPTKIETNKDGSPKLGTLHTFDINKPLKTHEGVGQGQGAIGKPIQGHTGIPYLHNLKVIQSMGKNKAGEDVVQRSLVTFRMASSSQLGRGLWDHPGTPGAHLFPGAEQFILDNWTKMAPDFVRSVLASI